MLSVSRLAVFKLMNMLGLPTLLGQNLIYLKGGTPLPRRNLVYLQADSDVKLNFPPRNPQGD